MRQFLARGIGIGFQVSHGSHNEAGHAERALKSLLVDDTLLYGVQSSVGACQAFDGHNFPATHRVCEHRTRIMRNIVDKDGARSAFSAVASEFGASEAQFVTQRPSQRLLLHDIDAPLLTVDVESNQPLAYASSQLLALQKRGGAKQIARGRNCHAAGDDAFDEVAPGDSFRHVFFRQVFDYLETCLLCHTQSPLIGAAAVRVLHVKMERPHI